MAQSGPSDVDLRRELKERLLEASAPIPRTELVTIVGQYALSTCSEEMALAIQRIDTLLTDEIRKQLNDAYAPFISGQALEGLTKLCDVSPRFGVTATRGD